MALMASFCFCLAQARQSYWQQELRYSIDVTLNDQLHSLDGFMNLEYRNQSPDTLHYIWFHVWPNAYKNDRTAFSDQLLENGRTDFYFSDEEERGYMNRLLFRVDGVTATMEDHPSHIDIIKLVLPRPLLPGATTNISTSFHVQLPEIFSRSGHKGQHYQVAQWYPRPAVYDRNGWHEMPYLDQGEFYGEFGQFEVRITVPSNYVVAASGVLQNAEEKEWLNGRANFRWEPETTKVKTRGGAIRRIKQEFPVSSGEYKTLRYTLDRAHDFAWFADKRFIVRQEKAELPSGKKVDLFAYYLPEQDEYWHKVTEYARKSIEARSEWIGDYPYPVFSVVQSDKGGIGGMEYPGLTLISPIENDALLHYMVAHEAGHNWFQAALGTNERNHPWLDEGLNTYYDHRYSQKVWGESGELQFMKVPVRIEAVTNLLTETAISTHTDQPIQTDAARFSASNYNMVAYGKAAQWLQQLEEQLGRDTLDQAIRAYYQQWQFRHPAPADFFQVLEAVSGRDLLAHRMQLYETGSLPGKKRKGFRVALPLSRSNIRQTLEGTHSHTMLLSPVAGYNMYDKLMAGVIISNVTLPVPRFQYLLAPLYGTGSRRFGGLGLVNYSHYPRSNRIYRIDMGISASSFTINEFTTPDGEQLFFGMNKWVPGIRVQLREPSARSTRERYIQFKTFLFREEGLRFSRDSIFTGTDTLIQDNYRKQAGNRSLAQLKLVWQDFRALYPYRAELKMEQGKDFLRAAFTGNYFFNYANGGGLNARFFAGKFFYTGAKTISKQFETDRYHLNMTGANGYEDYTYSDYFLGRNEFEGLASQQIMERDGGFKTRTDLLASKVGRTDNWLIAVNLSSSIPDKWNPLSLLPIKIPLKVFADIGTYAEAWDRSANLDRFLFDAGLQVSLLKETVHIYLPLIYSSPFRDYIESTIPKKERLLKKISFSIDLSNFSFRKINRNLAF